MRSLGVLEVWQTPGVGSFKVTQNGSGVRSTTGLRRSRQERRLKM